MSYGVRLLSVVVAIVIWHLASSTGLKLIVSFENVPTPMTVWEQMVQLLGTSGFYVHIAVSAKRILIGYVLAASIGVPIGVAMGRLRWMHDLMIPHIEVVRPIPAVAWIPLAILIWPTEESSTVLNTIHGVEQTPEVLVRAGRCLGASQLAVFWHVVIPAALPSITTGLAIGMGVAWFSLLAGEIISGQYGIGYFTWQAYSLVQYPSIIIGMLMIGLLGLTSTAIIRLLMRPFLKWQPRHR